MFSSAIRLTVLLCHSLGCSSLFSFDCVLDTHLVLIFDTQFFDAYFRFVTFLTERLLIITNAFQTVTSLLVPERAEKKEKNFIESSSLAILRLKFFVGCASLGESNLELMKKATFF